MQQQCSSNAAAMQQQCSSNAAAMHQQPRWATGCFSRFRGGDDEGNLRGDSHACVSIDLHAMLVYAVIKHFEDF